MKIAFIGQKGIPAKQGGIEKHVQELSTRLAQYGLDVTIYSRYHYTHSQQNNYHGVNIINLPSINTKHLDAITHTLFSTIHALFQGYDIIHYQGVGPSLLSWIPRIFCPRTKVVSTFHCLDSQHQKWGYIARTFLTLGEWTTCHFSHQTIVVSKILKKYCQWKFNRDAFYIPNGASLTQKPKLDYEKKILNKYNLKKDDYILSVSRLTQHKGIHTLIQAYLKTKTTKKLVIVGSSADTDNYVNYLMELAKNNPNIIFTGQLIGTKLDVIYKNAYLFVQPSETEGLSVALLEAMSYHTPALTSNIKENLEVINNHGLKFQNRNISSLTQQINYALDHPIIIKELAQAASKKVEREYNWDTITKNTATLYHNLLHQLLGNQVSW